jgi:hypothetical protein
MLQRLHSSFRKKSPVPYKMEHTSTTMSETAKEVPIQANDNVTNVANEFGKLSAAEVAALDGTVDCVICMDCTGSMGSWIEAAKTTALETAIAIRERMPACDYRLGFVGYRDYGADDVLFPLTHDIEGLKAQLRSVGPAGGDDCCEDVAGGFRTALNEQWRTDGTCICIHVADAPAHGSQFHDGVGDSYPAGDKHGLDPLKQIAEFASRGIDYYFVKIQAMTDKMTRVFHEAYTAAAKNDACTFMVIDMQGQLTNAAGAAMDCPAPVPTSDSFTSEAEYDEDARPCRVLPSDMERCGLTDPSFELSAARSPKLRSTMMEMPMAMASMAMPSMSMSYASMPSMASAPAQALVNTAFSSAMIASVVNSAAQKQSMRR